MNNVVWWRTGVMCLVCLFTLTVYADSSKAYVVTLLDNNGVAIKVADLQLFPEGDAFRYELKMVTKTPFENYFLSMRPFNCITEQATKRALCYLNYPYKINRRISANDLGDLEYDLLFIRRKASDYGIDPWFGSYYKMQWKGDSIEGILHEADLDILAAPPEDGAYRPIVESDLTETDASQFWLPRLMIEPRLN
jgi:hypothetical protein